MLNLHTICTYISWFCKVEETHFLRNPPLSAGLYVLDWLLGHIARHHKERKYATRSRLSSENIISELCSALLQPRPACVTVTQLVTELLSLYYLEYQHKTYQSLCIIETKKLVLLEGRLLGIQSKSQFGIGYISKPYCGISSPRSNTTNVRTI